MWCSHRLKNSMSFTTTISSYFTSYNAPLTNLLHLHLVAAGQELQRLVHALRRAHQAVALRVFAQPSQHLLDQRSDRSSSGSPAASPSQLLYSISSALTSKMFRGVSPMRIFSSFGHSPGNTSLQLRFNRRQISTAKILRRRHHRLERRHLLVQIAVIERRQHLLRHQPVQQPADPPPVPSLVERPANAHLHHVVVPMTVGVVALPVQLPVFLLAQLGANAADARPRTRTAGLRGTRLALRNSPRTDPASRTPGPRAACSRPSLNCGSSRRQMSRAIFSVVGTTRSKGGTS